MGKLRDCRHKIDMSVTYDVTSVIIKIKAGDVLRLLSEQFLRLALITQENSFLCLSFRVNFRNKL